MGTILESIYAGKYDKSLDRIEEAIRHRKLMKLDRLEVGDRVRISRNARPTYIAGKIGTIREFRRTRILIDLEGVEGTRFRRGILCNPTSLEVVEEVKTGQT